MWGVHDPAQVFCIIKPISDRVLFKFDSKRGFEWLEHMKSKTREAHTPGS